MLPWQAHSGEFAYFIVQLRISVRFYVLITCPVIIPVLKLICLYLAGPCDSRCYVVIPMQNLLSPIVEIMQKTQNHYPSYSLYFEIHGIIYCKVPHIKSASFKLRTNEPITTLKSLE
jgi:hypothetical protein